MENKEIAGEAILSARRWLESSQATAKDGNYDVAIYGLEMSVEIALKAVMLSIGVETPKIHAIGDAFAKVVKENGRVPLEFSSSLTETIGTFNKLLELRSVAGYMFESGDEFANFEKQYNALEGSACRVVAMCEKAVRSISGKGRG